MQKYNRAASNSSHAGSDSMTNSSEHGESARSSTPSISQEQYDQLMTLLKNSSVNHSSASTFSQQVNPSTSVNHSLTDQRGSVSLFSSFCCNVNQDTWIIDSGASDHFCGSLKWFDSYNQITPIGVRLPTGHHTFAKIAGTIKFSSSLILHDVLYVPDFTLNLISVSKMCNALGCHVLFNGSHV
jgi:hypothetical protein